MSDDYVLPPEFDQLDEKTPFGHNMLKYFQFEPGYTNINHGSYGSLPKCIADCYDYWRRRVECCPDRWFRYEWAPHMEKAARAVAKYMNVGDSKDLAFIPNASAGVNAVVRSLKLNSKDVVLFLSETYGAVKRTIQYAADFRDADFHEIVINFPFDDDELIETVENVLRTYDGRVKLASFSHISSVPSAIFPIKKLIDLCRKYSSYALIDAAHALGQTKVDIQALDPDFYLSNGHKWLYTPRGSGVLYVKKELQPLVQPTVISWNYKLGFQKEFHQLGTLDYSNFLTFPTAIEFRRRLGEDRIINYNHSLAVKAGEIMAKLWNTEVVVHEHQIGAMVNVRLPINDSLLVNTIVEKLMLSYRTYFQTYQEKDVWYARLSAQIYNEEKDFEDIGRAFLDMLEFVKVSTIFASACII